MRTAPGLCKVWSLFPSKKRCAENTGDALSFIKKNDTVRLAILKGGIETLIQNRTLKIPGIVPGQEVKIECLKKKKISKK